MSKRPLSRREKILTTLTILVAVGIGGYFGFIEGFLMHYQTVSAELASAIEQLERQHETLREGPKVDADFAEIEGSLSKPGPGKSPDMAFSEDMEMLFRALRLQTPEFGRITVKEIPRTTGFSYLALPIERVRTDLAGLTTLLKSLADRNLLIMRLHVRSAGAGRSRQLETRIEIAQVIRSEEIRKSQSTTRTTR